MKTTLKISPYETITTRIVESLKAGVIPWAKPWKSNVTGGSFPRNFRTGAPYRGANILMLWASSYTSPYWLTFRQAQELGGSVRKGEQGTKIAFWNVGKRDGDDVNPATPDATVRHHCFCRLYTVFNIEQCDGLKMPDAVICEAVAISQDERCESLIGGWANRPTLNLDNAHEGRAYYRPATDSVHMPTRNRFVDAPHYYATLFHELIHSTGHESRLSRTFGDRFADELYSKEELIAEIGSSFLCAIAGIANERTEENTTAYIQHWIKALEGDSRLVLTAAASAQKAADAIIGYSFTEERDGDDEETQGRSTDASMPAVLSLAA